MSGDELLVLVICGVLAWWRWRTWLLRVSQPSGLVAHGALRWPLTVAPVLSVAVLLVVLLSASSHDVRGSVLYIAFYLIMGLGWVGAGTALLPFLGISPRDDAVERANHGASRVSAAAVLSLTLCFAGANIGEGPGWWVVVFCAALSTAALLVLWFLVAMVGLGTRAVIVERDAAAALRLAGFLLGAGLVLGRSVAGDWISVGQTMADFGRITWPLPLAALVASAVDRAARPTAKAPHSPPLATGVLPGAAYVAAAAAYVIWLGAW